jgi:dsRNA-specific ribonuclease
MGLHKWVILSKHAELKQTRTNLKKLGCLFEAFIGAMFLDFNHSEIRDEEGLFKNVFLCGAGFQTVQVFLENVFERHVDWIHLIRNDDNFKNILQVKIQKEFKVTPHYVEMEEHNVETGYTMGVFLCLGQPIHSVDMSQMVSITDFVKIQDIHEYMSKYHKIFLFLGKGVHKIKKKAEQIACNEAIKHLER